MKYSIRTVLLQHREVTFQSLRWVYRSLHVSHGQSGSTVTGTGPLWTEQRHTLTYSPQITTINMLERVPLSQTVSILLSASFFLLFFSSYIYLLMSFCMVKFTNASYGPCRWNKKAPYGFGAQTLPCGDAVQPLSSLFLFLQQFSDRVYIWSYLLSPTSVPSNMAQSQHGAYFLRFF